MNHLRYISIPSPRCGKRVCKHHRRQIVLDMFEQIVMHENGGIATWPTPRGKIYPYASLRQNARDKIQWLKHASSVSLQPLPLPSHSQQLL